MKYLVLFSLNTPYVQNLSYRMWKKVAALLKVQCCFNQGIDVFPKMKCELLKYKCDARASRATAQGSKLRDVLHQDMMPGLQCARTACSSAE